MADRTGIEWTDATWNPVTGCSVVSPGCTNCYAMKLAGTRLQHHRSRAGLTVPSKAGPVWNGQVRLNTDWLDQPLRWKRPRKIFVCAHGDLFHENVPDDWIDKVFAVMALAPQHTFQVLTKRAERMREYLSADGCRASILDQWLRLPGPRKNRVTLVNGQPVVETSPRWPLPNVWLGVSAEDQARADERIPLLLQTPAAVRFVSAEPLLGAIDLHSRLCRETGSCPSCPRCLGGIDWIILGGESGPGARPMDIDWTRSIVAQCRNAGVPCFVKQLGPNPTLHGFTGMPIKDKKGGDWSEWPEDLRIREFPHA
jgi:protein gp37